MSSILIRGVILPPRKKTPITDLVSLSQEHHKDIYGVHVELFTYTTGWPQRVLKNLVNDLVLKLVKADGKTYIVKDRWWVGLLAYSKSLGHEVNIHRCSYTKLKYASKA